MEQHLQNAERKNCQPNSLYPGKIIFKNKSKLKTFSDKGKLCCYQQICTEIMLKNSFRLKGNDSREKLRSSRKNEEH